MPPTDSDRTASLTLNTGNVIVGSSGAYIEIMRESNIALKLSTVRVKLVVSQVVNKFPASHGTPSFAGARRAWARLTPSTSDLFYCHHLF
jgi:hypothetical protein